MSAKIIKNINKNVNKNTIVNIGITNKKSSNSVASIIRAKALNSPTEYWIGFLLLAVFMVVLHFLVIDTNFGDDVKFRQILIKEDFNVWNAAANRWKTITSRFGIELVMFIFQALPQVVWKVVDCVVILGLYKITSMYTKQYITLALMMCAYPFMHMASAGWIATTMNYLWPFMALILATHWLFMKKNRRSAPVYIFYFLLLAYFIFSEIMLVTYTCILILFIVEHKGKITRTDSTLILLSFTIMLLGYLNALFSPGNSGRGDIEILRWMPEFPDLSLFERFRICTVSTLQHFTSIPNVLFFVFNALLIYGVWKLTDKRINRLLSVVPMLIDIITTVYYLYTEVIRKHSLNYVLPEVTIVVGNREYIIQMYCLIAALLYIITSLYSVYTIFLNNTHAEAIKNCFVFLVGMGTRFILIFSPTMLASGTRIYFIGYMAMIWLGIKTVDKTDLSKNKLMTRLMYGILTIGLIINAVMVVMMQVKYGGHLLFQ